MLGSMENEMAQVSDQDRKNTGYRNSMDIFNIVKILCAYFLAFVTLADESIKEMKMLVVILQKR